MEKIRIQDDLYNYVNQEWLEKAVIPDDKPSTGGFADLRTGVEDTLIKDFIAFGKKKKYPNEYLKNAGIIFEMVRDTDKRNAEGIEPALPVLEKIDSLKNLEDFNSNLKEFVENGIKLPFTMEVVEDMMDTSNYCLLLTGPGVILPDCTYYKPEMAAQKKMFLKAWNDMAKTVMSKTKLSAQKQKKYIKDALAFDELLAGLVKSMQEWADYVTMYNPMKPAKVYSMLKPVNFKKLLADEFETEPEKIIVAEPRYFKGFKTVFNEENFELYKHWAYVLTLLDCTACLSEELREVGGSYGRAISGIAAMPKVDKYAYTLASNLFDQPVGLYYGEKYFGEAAKQDVIEMVKEIIEVYKKRVAKNDFLSEETKKKAILKLEAMGLKLAYPDKIDAVFSTMKADPKKNLLENISELNRIQKVNNLKKLGTKVDRSKWIMPGNMVNACYNPSLNDITFPAAILQAPFYSIKQTRSQNLGGIGAVIAHEISHAFDNNGAQFDENGNLNNWWTKEDLKRFNARTKAMVREFDGIELPWGKVNGKFTVSENIADNGGMAATLEVMSATKSANYKEYFENWARIWCMKAKPEYLALLISVDVHGPAMLRANMQPRNFDEWYETYGVTKKDKMYLAPSKRVHIW